MPVEPLKLSHGTNPSDAGQPVTAQAVASRTFSDDMNVAEQALRYRVNRRLKGVFTGEQDFSAIHALLEDETKSFRKYYEEKGKELAKVLKFLADYQALEILKSTLSKARNVWHNEKKFIEYLKDSLDGNRHSLNIPSLAERTERLAGYVKQYGSDGAEEYARALFPEWFAQNPIIPKTESSVVLPDVAPEIFQGLRGPEPPPAFVQRVYSEWLGKGLTRAHIRNLDPTLYTAIHNWLKKPGCEWPADVDLPTLKEQNDRDFALMAASESQGIFGKFTGKEAARIGAAMARRSK